MPHGVIENFEKTSHFPIILNTTVQYSTKSEQVKAAMPIFLNFSPASLLKKA